MSSLRIIACTGNEIPELARVARQSYLQHYRYLWHDHGEAYVERCFTEAVLRQELAQPGSAFFIAYFHQSPAGFLKLNLHRSLPGEPEKNALEVERIYLLEEASGKGAGKALMEFAAGIAGEMGKQVIWLKAMDSSPAVAFYEKLGFQAFGTHRLTLPQMKDEFRGMVIMRKDISEK